MQHLGHTGALPRCMFFALILLHAFALHTQSDPLATPSTGKQSSRVLAVPKFYTQDASLDHGSMKTPAPAVPTTARCIIIICIQFVVVYTAVAICRTYCEITGAAKGGLEAAFSASAQTLTYGPMLCVLFIACRMRVEYLSDGKDQPQAWVQTCMYALTFAVMASTILVFAIQLMTGKPLPPKGNAFDLERAHLDEGTYGRNTLVALNIIRYSILFALYGGIAGVMVGMCIYLPPGVEKLSQVEAPAPAVLCTMVLVVVFFSTQLIIAACRSYTEFTRLHFPQVVGMMQAAAATVDFAPMLAVLFLAARMRAVQHDSHPQEWAQNCMFVATGAFCVTSLLAIMVPLVMAGSLKTNPWTNEMIVEVPNPTLGYIFMGLRYVCMLLFYAGVVGVIVSIFAFESPGGPTATLPISPTVQCVVSLTCQFFFVYFVLTVMLSLSELMGGVVPMEKWSLFSAVEAARSTLNFAPMLSILFVATRMYALLITDKKGAPPAWVQDGMYMSTWSLQISGLMCLATGVIMAKVETDDDGNVINKFDKWHVGIAVVIIRYLSMFLLYSGMVMVIVGLCTMTPETANGRGSFQDVYGSSSVGSLLQVSSQPHSRPSSTMISTLHKMVQMGSL